MRRIVIAAVFGSMCVSSFAGAESSSVLTVRGQAAACKCDEIWRSVYSRTSPAFNDKGKDARAHARFFEGLARKNPRLTRRAIIAQGKYSDVENLPFLYGFTNNVEYAGLAANAIARVLGATSNSVEIVDHVMGMESVSPHEKFHICTAIAEMAKWSGASEGSRQLAVSALRRYAGIIPESSEMANEIYDNVTRASDEKVEEKNESARTITYEEVKAAFLSATVPSFCGNVSKATYDHALKLCGGDGRLISRIAKEIAAERPDRIPWAISALANHGSTDDVPFLIGYTNDVNYAARAISAVICISGVTSNAVELADNIMYGNLKRSHDGYDICSALAYATKKDGASSDSKQLSIAVLKKYSRTIPVTSLWADEFLLSLDPSYETSEDRKALLREVAARRVNDYQIDYATNALKRIDAKIQSERKGD